MANVIAVIWDFDRTLVDGYMQDPIFKKYNVDAAKFWADMVAEEKNKIQYLEQEIDSLKRELEDSKNNLQHSRSEQQRLHNIIQENSSALQELQSQKSLLAAAEKENKALQSEVDITVKV